MEILLGLGVSFWLAVICIAIGSFLALPLIWYHTGHVSRKLSKLIELQKETNTSIDKLLNKNKEKQSISSPNRNSNS